jgi:hypothetical protein
MLSLQLLRGELPICPAAKGSADAIRCRQRWYRSTITAAEDRKVARNSVTEHIASGRSANRYGRCYV